MTRFVQIALVAVLGLLGSVAVATAQSVFGEGRVYAEFTAAATFGHKSSGAFGGEGGFWLTDMFGVYAEGGHMQNVATEDIEDRASLIASHIGTTAEVTQAVNYFAAGVVGRFPMGRISPMGFFGIGGAKVTNSTDFAAPPGSEVQLGGDLDGDYSKTFVTVGVGARVRVYGPWFSDITYRFGNIGEEKEFELESLKTNRLQFGVGYSF